MSASAELSDGSRAQTGRAPDFYVVGQYKCGTTALYEMLRGHPQIFMPRFKEVWFHSREMRVHRKQLRRNRRPETLQEYLSLFAAARPEQRIGETTPSYLLCAAAAGRIAELTPDARIVAILREPASYLRSFHLQCLSNYTETEKDLRKALALEGPRREGKRIPPHAARPAELLYSDHLRYVQQLRRYETLFGRERMLVLIYEDFRADNAATVREILRFLEVDESHPIETVEANPTVRVRSTRLNELARSVYMGRGRGPRAAKGAIKAIAPRSVRKRAFSATQRHVLLGAPRPPDEQLMLELRRRSKDEVVALSEYLDRDLVSFWGYDEL
ncbi:MAG TPA: sulfotransferase [Solirubrobacteraceae bacterium]|nr:sulfotransferase [Solirubrobacteraceae bacterium]